MLYIFQTKRVYNKAQRKRNSLGEQVTCAPFSTIYTYIDASSTSRTLSYDNGALVRTLPKTREHSKRRIRKSRAENRTTRKTPNVETFKYHSMLQC